MRGRREVDVKITREWLEDRGACADQVELFARLYPDGVVLSRAALIEAAANGLRVSWLGARVLRGEQRAEYERQAAQLWAEYLCHKGRLWAECNRKEAPLRAEYERQVVHLEVEYERRVAPLLADALAANDRLRELRMLRVEQPARGVI